MVGLWRTDHGGEVRGRRRSSRSWPEWSSSWESLGSSTKKIEPNEGGADGGSMLDASSTAVSSEPAGSEPPPAPTQPPPAPAAAYPVLSVVDGDTLHVAVDGLAGPSRIS